MIVLVGGLVSEAVACSCGGESTVKSARTSASAIFLGVVVSVSVENEWIEEPDAQEKDCRNRISKEGGNRIFCQGGLVTVQLEVLKSWQGLKKDKAIVQTDIQGSACGIEFKLGDAWLVYASGDPDGILVTNACRRTRGWEFAREDIQELGVPEHDYFVEMGSAP